MSLIRLTLEYDGTEFVGWQFQTNGRSVQGEIEKAIKKILQIDVRITGGGRTDAGVHARGQVASFYTEQEIDIRSFGKSLNAVLSRDIVVRDLCEAPRDFNARHNAKSRRYKYFISQEPTAIQRNTCWQVFQNIDVDLMQKCAQTIHGEHDFRSFSKLMDDVHQYRCTVQSATWMQTGQLLVFDITANRFLYGMVRALVGTMVNVGRSHTQRDDFEKILTAKDRACAGMSAPAKGLFLEEILY